jgi:membrane fusion protein (multidrug efflux system)
MKKWLIGVAVLALLIGAKLIFFPGKAGASKAGPKSKGPTPVQVYVVRPEPLNRIIQSPGVLLASERVDLMPEASGRIVSIAFGEGKRVQKGQLLVKLNDADLQAQLKRIQLQEALQSSRTERLRQLAAVKGVSAEELEIAENTLATLHADEELLMAQIRKTEIRAPFDGTIGIRAVSEGAWVGPGTRIATLVEDQGLKLAFSIASRYAERIAEGTQLKFRQTGDTTLYLAQVYAREAQASEGSRMIAYQATVSAPKASLLPGKAVEVGIPLSSRSDALLIPTQCIVPVLKGQKVYVVRNGKADEVQVSTDYRTATMVEVTQGLQPGDSVVTTGLLSLRKGGEVKVIPTPKPKS